MIAARRSELLVTILFDDEDDDDEEEASVDTNTPAMIPPKLEISMVVNRSRPYVTAKMADVMGSAALIVSTYDGLAAPNARFVV